jgi:putative sterol carrier protein
MDMTSKDEVLEAVSRMVSKVKDPKLEDKFREYNKTMQMTYTDIGLDVTITFDSGTATIAEGEAGAADMMVTTDSTTILNILNGSQSAMRAFMSGKIKVKGSTRDLLKLQHLLKA